MRCIGSLTRISEVKNVYDNDVLSLNLNTQNVYYRNSNDPKCFALLLSLENLFLLMRRQSLLFLRIFFQFVVDRIEDLNDSGNPEIG